MRTRIQATPGLLVVPAPPSRRPVFTVWGIAVAGCLLVIPVGLGAWRWYPRPPATSGGHVAESVDATDRPSAPDRATSSGRQYTRIGLARQVEGLRRGESGPSPRVRGTLASPVGLAACLTALGRDRSDLAAADLGLFDQKPAAILVFEESGSPAEIWVVSVDCRIGADGLRYFERLA